jgi:hypothetical protein
VSREIRIIYTLVAMDDDLYDEYQLLRGEGIGAQSSSSNTKAYRKNTERIPKESVQVGTVRYRSASPQ